MSREIHLSTHIEKTAGTSLQAFLIQIYGANKTYIYSSKNDSLVSSQSLLQKARVNLFVDKLLSSTNMLGFTPIVHKFAQILRPSNSEKDLVLPPNCDLIHGHFVADRFDNLVEKPFRTIVFREPLERMISHYYNWQRSLGMSDQRLRMQYQQNISFKEFCNFDEMKNYQSKYLGGLSIHDFDVVGITENIYEFTNEVARIRNYTGANKPNGLKRLNKGLVNINLSHLGVDENFTRWFKRTNELDYCNFNKAKAVSEKFRYNTF